MRLFILYFCAFFFVFSNSAFASDICADIKPRETIVNIDVIMPEPHYNLGASKRYLTKKSKEVTEDWLKKHDMEVLWKAEDLQTAGIASAGQGLVYEAKLYAEPVDRYNAYYCTYFDEITVTVFYRTLIYIPKNYPKGTCAFEDINQHELRHHQANKEVVGKYAMLLEQDIGEMITLMEKGHAPRDQVEERIEEIKLGLKDAIQIYARDSVIKEMEERNAMIDTPEEYERGSQKLRECMKLDGNVPRH